MTDEMKLLRAFIEAAGYEIEETTAFAENPDGGKCPITEFGYKVTKKAKTTRKAKAEGYTGEFEQCWSCYPSRPNNNKANAYRAYSQRIKEGEDHAHLCSKTYSYLKFCEATDKIGKETVLQASTFYGPSKRYNDDFTVQKEAIKLPRNNDDLEQWAIDNGHPRSNPGELYPAYRRRLESIIG